MPMKNKIIPLLLLFSLWGVLARLQAMPPKPMKGKQAEEKTEEEKQEGARILEEQGRRITSSGAVDLSSALERGSTMGASEKGASDEGNENFDLSSSKLDETLAIIQ